MYVKTSSARLQTEIKRAIFKLTS